MVLLAMGSTFMLAQRRLLLLVALAILIGGSILVFQQRWLQSPCTRETNYFCIKVREQDEDGETVRVLILDRLVHSYTSLNNPYKLVYGYEKMYAEVTAYQHEQHNEPLRALFIGGGGYTFPRYMEAVYPNSKIDVIEIDPGVTQIAYDFLGLDPETGITSYNEDARMFLAQNPSQRYHLIMGDAFNDFSVPYHLTTQEFNQRVKTWLTEDGYYVVNIIDGGQGDFLRAYTHTLYQTFDHIYLAPTIEGWRQSPRSTFVLIAGDTPLDFAVISLVDAGDGDTLFARRVLWQKQVDDILAEGRTVLLTDQYAPVDQLLAPVTRGEIQEQETP
jgi:spermidine synthase